MTALADLVLEAPTPGSGSPTGDGTWRLVVEVLLPAHHRSVVGVAVVGTDVVTADVWTDMAEWLQGVMIRPGASDFGDHPDTATLDFTLRSPAHRFAPWAAYGQPGSPARFSKGTPVRAGFISDTEWRPMFTGEIDTAGEISVDDVGIVLQVTAIDTVAARLPGVQLVEYPVDPDVVYLSVADLVSELVNDVALFPYGVDLDIQIDDAGDDYGVAGYMLLSGNLLEQLRRIADALGRMVTCDAHGRLAMLRRRPKLTTYSNAYTPADDPNEPDPVVLDLADLIVDTLLPVRAPDAIVNDVEILNMMEIGIFGPADVGGDQQAVRSTAAAGATLRHGQRSTSSQSLLDPYLPCRFVTVTNSDEASALRRGRRQVRLDSMFPISFGRFVAEQLVERIVDLHAGDLWRIPGCKIDNRQMDTIAALEVGAPATITAGGATFTGFIGSIEISSIPMPGRCKVVATFSVNVYTLERAAP